MSDTASVIAEIVVLSEARIVPKCVLQNFRDLFLLKKCTNLLAFAMLLLLTTTPYIFWRPWQQCPSLVSFLQVMENSNQFGNELVLSASCQLMSAILDSES